MFHIFKITFSMPHSGLEKAQNVEKPLSESVTNWKGLSHCCVVVVLLMKTLHKQWNFTLLSVSLWRDWVCSSLHRAANRIKPCKVGAVSPVLAFDPNSALFKRPSLTERELCQFNGALCHVRQAKRCSACLCSAVLESCCGRLVLQTPCVCGWGDLNVCACARLCMCVYISVWLFKTISICSLFFVF